MRMPMNLIVIRAKHTERPNENDAQVDVIERIIALSNVIFGNHGERAHEGPHEAESGASSRGMVKYSSAAEWKRRLELGGLIVLCMEKRPREIDGIQTKQNPQPGDEPIGFLFAHLRSHTESPLTNNTVESMHIWLAGVLPEFRRQGLLEQMVTKLVEEEKKRQGSCINLTVCTVPAQFPAMWAWLRSRGWVVEKEIASGKFLLSQAHEPSK